MTIQDFIKKYGTHTLGVVVRAFIKEAPEFKGDKELAKEIGQIMGDLESALQLICRGS